jgi:hypothetical protein
MASVVLAIAAPPASSAPPGTEQSASQVPRNGTVRFFAPAPSPDRWTYNTDWGYADVPAALHDNVDAFDTQPNDPVYGLKINVYAINWSDFWGDCRYRTIRPGDRRTFNWAFGDVIDGVSNTIPAGCQPD